MLKALVLMTSILALPATATAELWGSSKSGTYHLASCRYVEKIRKEYRIKFTDAAAAKKAGYRPCETCRPPGGGNIPLKPVK